MAVKIKDKLTADGQAFMRELKNLASLEVKVGYQRGDAKAEGEVDLVDIAAWNELGTYNSPPRPFLAQSVDNNKDKINSLAKGLTKKFSASPNAKKMLNGVGVGLVGIIQDTITNGDFIPNSGITVEGGWMRNKKSGKAFKVKGKGSNKPLIDTGMLRQSVRYVIKKKEK